ncbi:carbamoyltransferase, partial [Candidatus Pelagibacter ubique]|nr:carbamoyltransferase [Candidatus Pelagibacter ubique]
NQIVAAIEEERFTRIKHFSGFPVQSIDYCLKKGNLEIKDIDYISLNTSPLYNFQSKLFFSLKNLSKIQGLTKKLKRINKKWDINNSLYQYFGNTKKIKIDYVSHHIAHASASIFNSDIDNGLSIAFDAAGDFSTIEVHEIKGYKFKKLKSTKFPHSLGILYQALTQYLGFKDYGDEYKVMGLAAHGKSTYLEKLKKLCSFKNGEFKLNLKYFVHHKIGFNFDFPNGYPFYDNLFSNELINLLGPPRIYDHEITQKYRDIAMSIQKLFENIFQDIIFYYNKEKKYKNLFLSGGCAFNALNNKSIGDKNDFEKIIIYPNSGDAGGALGSALYTNFKLNKSFKKNSFTSLYLGTEETEDEISNNIHELFFDKKNEFECEKFSNNEIFLKKLAIYLNDGLVVAWHQGRMEFGPRALGNRSILANPSISNIKDSINNKIKSRESFRPFAPSVLTEKADEYFVLHKSLNYKFMNVICDVKTAKKKLIPGVINVDGTARPQLVEREINSLYYDLINEFYKLSKIPMLLNTSLNINEPICRNSKDTISCFLRSKIDLLAIGNNIIKRIQ